MKAKILQTTYFGGHGYKAGRVYELDKDQAKNIPHKPVEEKPSKAAKGEVKETSEVEAPAVTPEDKQVEGSADKMVKKANKKTA